MTAEIATAGQVIVGAVSPLPGARVTEWEISRAMRTLPVEQRPAYVQSAPIPRTAWARPQTEPLREAGIPKPGDGVPVWRLADDGEAYDRLT